jgi:hypothetical protein
MPPLLLRATSLESAIEDLKAASAPFEDPFSADLAALRFDHDFETPETGVFAPPSLFYNNG